MAKRSLAVTSNHIQEVDRALTTKGWSYDDLAEAGECSRQPAVKFCTGKSVDRKLFVSFCRELNLDWEKVSNFQTKTLSAKHGNPVQSGQTDALHANIEKISELTKEARTSMRAEIQDRCGQMRVLDMSRPIGLGDIYTDVNILETVTSRRRLAVNDLLENFDPASDDFDRRGLGRVVEERVSGLHVVDKYPKLMVLGKPGAGKTTFLKHLAIQCMRGRFYASKIPVFVTLKDFSETESQPTLLDYVSEKFSRYNISKKQVEEILHNGRIFLLLDGLDEVRNEDSKRVLRQIEKMSRDFFLSKEFKHDQSSFLNTRDVLLNGIAMLDKGKSSGVLHLDEDSPESLVSELGNFVRKHFDELTYSDISSIHKLSSSERTRLTNRVRAKINATYPNLLKFGDQGLDFLTKANPSKEYFNNYIVTCRVAAQEYHFQGFSDVEVADFDGRQIRMFASKWFKKNPTRGNNFIRKLEKNKDVRELACSPLLLTLLCLIFETSPDFPTNRSELYEEGISVLLKKWDAERSIERDQIYRNLSAQRKEDMISHIAWVTFNNSDYFFNQKKAKKCILEYIENLPKSLDRSRDLDIDSEVILKAIEAQHGLLVERAKGIYSFSHLTFHEYFTARKLVTISEPQYLEKAFKILASHVFEKRWREVILLAVEMLPNSGRFLLLIKQRIDLTVTSCQNSQQVTQFLYWIRDKFSSAKASPQDYLRALYVSLYKDSEALPVRGLKGADEKLLKEYHYANTLLITCLNSECYVTRLVRDKIEKNLLAPGGED